MSAPTDAPELERTAPAAAPAPAPSAAPARRHIATLDAVRGLAILAVILAHVAEMFARGPRPASLVAWLGVTGEGWVGVDLFFALSGFLITGILHDTRGSRGYFRNFFGRRVVRIFPLYYGALAVVLLVVPALRLRSGLHDAIAGDQAWFWLYGVNLLVALRGETFPWAHFWSLAVEEHFYLAWPFVVAALPRRRLMAACLGLAAASAACRAWLALGGHAFAAYFLTPSRLDPLALGAFAALAIRGPGGVEAVRPAARRAALACLAMLAAFVLWRGRLDEFGVPTQLVAYPLLAGLFAALMALAAAARPPWPIRAVDVRPLRVLGKYSYGMYVLHPLALGAVAKLLPYRGLSAATAWPAYLSSAAAALAATLALAWLSWHLYERPFLALKRYFEYGGTSGRRGEA